MENSLAYRGANHRIQSGAITAACQHSNSHVLPVLLSKRLSQSNRMIRVAERWIKRGRLAQEESESHLTTRMHSYTFGLYKYAAAARRLLPGAAFCFVV